MKGTIAEIKNLLLEDSITCEEAWKILTKSSTKPWQRKEWKEKRELLIKNSCEVCGSMEGPFTLQHTWHPPEVHDVRKYITSYLFNEFMELNIVSFSPTEIEIKEFINTKTEEKLFCPFCKKINPQERVTMSPRYRCQQCKKKFDDALVANYFPNTRTHIFNDSDAIELVRNTKIYYGKLEFIKINKAIIEKQTILLCMENHQRYISLDDTKTFCNRCAFQWDINGKVLCSSCKINYHEVIYPTCYDCFKNKNSTTV